MICHVDMDAFFASVEQMDDPALVGKCVIIGGISDRGVVAAASYEARQYGVRSAMPVYLAKKQCPGGVFLFPRRQRYKQVSEMVMDVLDTFSPVVEQVSIDEAYLDLSGCESLFGSHGQIGAAIKQKILQEVGLSSSVGITPLKFLAKIASDMDKPDGLRVVLPEEVQDFINALPVSKVPGVGPVTGKTLEKMGIRFLGDAGKYRAKDLAARLGRFGYRLHELSVGIDRSPVVPVRPVKSISSEETLASDTMDMAILEGLMLKHAEDVGRQARKKGVLAKTVFIKLKDRDFQQITRQAPLPEPTQSAEMIFRAGRELLAACRLQKPVRLAGLGVSDLLRRQTPVQMPLFEETGAAMKKWAQVDEAVDAIADRFGPDAVRKARLCDAKKNPVPDQ
ncbi:MAG: DNA polymerase IV [Desulfosalsimonadaceae bacterium]